MKKKYIPIFIVANIFVYMLFFAFATPPCILGGCEIELFNSYALVSTLFMDFLFAALIIAFKAD